MKPINPLLAGAGTTIFEAMSALAREHQATNLGQGFPDDRGPKKLLALAAKHVVDGNNQYPPMMGVPELRQAVAAHELRFYRRQLDWRTDVLITSGATEALHDCFSALLSPGDQAFVIEPAYDTYAPVIRRLGAEPVAVRCMPPTWALPREALEAAVTAKTKLLVFNAPMNPTGTVFTAEDLTWLASFVERFDLYVVADEVYEHLLYDGMSHQSLATLPGMHERCVRIGSAGKTFSLTGWKVGYVTGPAALIGPIGKAHQLATYTTPPHLQLAVAHGLALDDSYYQALASSMEARRDRLMSGLRTIGLEPYTSSATYFLVADVAPWMQAGETDVAFCQRLVREAGVVLIPLSAFYLDDAPRTLVRFCYCKSDGTIDQALQRLRAWRD